jgi:hypothetical protein
MFVLTGLFLIDNSTGQISLGLPLDRASKDQYILTIMAYDGGTPQKTNFTTIIIHVKDVNSSLTEVTTVIPTFQVKQKDTNRNVKKFPNLNTIHMSTKDKYH